MKNERKNICREGVWLRPGVIFWKGKNGSYLEDSISKKHLKLNDTSYFILKLCNGLDINQIIKEVKERFGENSNVEKDIFDFFRKIEAEGLIIKTPPENLMKKSEKAYFPLGVVFCELTYACNLRCKTCFNSSGIAHEDEMSTNEWKTTLEKIANIDPNNHPTMLFTGGEPLARNDFFEIASFAKKLGLTVQLFTNGTLIDNETSKRIAELNLEYIRISVDGAVPETNDFIRGKGSFNKALNAMKLLTEKGMKVCWQSVISQLNFKELDSMLENAISLGLDGFKASSVDPLGRGEEIESYLSPKQELMLWKFIEDSTIKYHDKIKIGWGADYCIDLEMNIAEIKRKKDFISNPVEHPEILRSYVTNSICGVGLKSFLITPSGNIALCPLLTAPELFMGHVLKDDLGDVWANGKPLQILRENSLEEFDECGTCGFRYSCLGGCRGLAYASKGRLTACDPKRLEGNNYFASRF